MPLDPGRRVELLLAGACAGVLTHKHPRERGLRLLLDRRDPGVAELARAVGRRCVAQPVGDGVARPVRIALDGPVLVGQRGARRDEPVAGLPRSRVLRPDRIYERSLDHRHRRGVRGRDLGGAAVLAGQGAEYREVLLGVPCLVVQRRRGPHEQVGVALKAADPLRDDDPPVDPVPLPAVGDRLDVDAGRRGHADRDELGRREGAQPPGPLGRKQARPFALQSRRALHVRVHDSRGAEAERAAEPRHRVLLVVRQAHRLHLAHDHGQPLVGRVRPGEDSLDRERHSGRIDARRPDERVPVQAHPLAAVPVEPGE